MLRLQIRAGVLLLGALLFVRPSLIAATQGPVAAMYADDQARGNAIPQGFAAASLPASGNAPATAQIYLTTGDLQRAFDEARFRPGAAIVPTNTELQLTARAPAEQILPVPYSDISSQTMLPISHIVWTSLWLGIATAADRGQSCFAKK